MADSLAHAHGTVMILAWIFFGSTGVLFARYGRVLRFGNRRQLLGKSIWFQTHRFLLSLSSLLTLLGFFFILVYRRGQWVNPSISGQQLFAHSIVGGIVVCCVIVQIWLALYRCHPHSRYRFIFDWSHRTIGSFAFGLAICNLFLITFVLPIQRIGLITIISLWTGWIVTVVILFKIMQYQSRKASALMEVRVRVSNTNQEPINTNPLPDTEAGPHPNVDNRCLNTVRLLLLLTHAIISVVICISFIFLIWNET